MCSLGTFSQQPNRDRNAVSKKTWKRIKQDRLYGNKHKHFQTKNQKQLKLQEKPRKKQIVRKQTTLLKNLEAFFEKKKNRKP